MTIDTDVLIIGAGPTGLMLANQLARRGVRTIIIDRHAAPARESRALGVQARTLEIYSRLGVADRALALGRRATGANLWSDGRRAARVPLGDIGRDVSPYPYLLILGQDDNERILGENLAQWNMAVQWNTELVALAQDDTQATATLKQPDGSLREVTASWVAGCDGARSAVRGLTGIAFDGAPYEHVFFVADIEASGAMVPDELNVYLWREGFHLLFPMRGTDHWRLVGILPPELRDRDDLVFDDVIPSIHQQAGTGMTFKSCDWFSTYRIHHRRAARFRDRRCFLLGDAAHIHSPVGAQGMNTGLQDAYNLAWKLALVVAGRAAPSLLDSYEEERIPVANRLLETTDRAFGLFVSASPLAALLRSTVLARVAAFGMRFQRVQMLAFLTISQTGIEYRGSSLSRTQPGLPAAAPQPGDRFPWVKLKLKPDTEATSLFEAIDDTRFTLLLFGKEPPTAVMPELDGMLNTIVVPTDLANIVELARVKISQPSFYLLRPDGHIAMAGTQAVNLGEAKDLLHLHAGTIPA
jgi:2-polyprenyl-6-methoxyphenol hydroxylase-like FAD-dependent oxidoreductase